ncbi:MAG: hypothetical protein K2K26_04265 [Muribaculaceae bacterium]|nr:hypothetical protein [Muribaculaceae bacterium]
MKHLNMFIAASAMMLPAIASAADYTVAPAPGVVDELTQFVITFDSTDLAEVELESGYVKVLKDGQFFSGITKKGYGFEFTCTLDTPATDPGTYEVVIEKDGIYYWSEDYAHCTLNKQPETFTYTIEGGQAVAHSYTVDPAPGVVDELTQFTITFDPTDLSEVELESGAVQILKNGQFFSGVTKKGYGFEFTCTLDTPATDPGKYEVVIEKGGITYWSEDYSESTVNTKPESFTYTIKGTIIGEVIYDIEFTKFRPNEGEIDLEEVQFDNFAMWTAGEGLSLAEGAAITITAANGYNETVDLMNPYANYYWGTLSNMITVNGIYTVTIPAATVVDIEYIETEGQSGHANAETKVVYNAFNGVLAGEPVVYDLTLDSVRPAEGERNLLIDTFDSISLTLPGDCAFANDVFTLFMDAPEEQGNIALEFTSSWGGTIAYFNEPVYDGVYTLVIPEGMFGNTEWIADHQSGHANAEITLQWTLTGGIPVSVEIIESEVLNGPVYNTQGIRVANSLREAGNGMFIVNGRKVIKRK